MAERPSLRLPAPPAKRQRAVSLDEEGTAKTADTQVADPGAAHSAAACGCSPLDAPVAAELDLPVALPNDAVVALLLLKSRFPLEVGGRRVCKGRDHSQLACSISLLGSACHNTAPAFHAPTRAGQGHPLCHPFAAVHPAVRPHRG